MSKAVPEGWKIVCLGEICSPRQWTTIPQTEFVEKGFPVFGANGQIGYYSIYNHEHETIAITCRGATCGNVRLTLPKSYITGNAMSLDDVDENKVDVKYLYYQLNHIGLKKITSGSAQPQIIRADLLKLPITLASFPEQQKIATILSSVDTAIEKTKAVIDQTKVVKKGLMQELLTKGIPGRHKRFKKTPIGEIPKEWAITKLGNVGQLYSGFTINKERIVKHNPKPYLRVANVQQGYFVLDEIKFLEATDDEFFPKQIKKNDILIIEGHANLSELGRCAVATDRVIGMTHQNHIHRFSPNSTLCNSQYIAFALSMRQVRRFIESGGGTTSGLHTLSKNSVSSIAIPSLNEQTLISNCILKVDKIIMENKNVYINLCIIKSALMQVLLTGEVRVKV